MSIQLDYSRNEELFAGFYACQREVAGLLAARPSALRTWLESRRAGEPARSPSGRVPRSWRTARLCAQRRRELASLIARAEGPEGDAGPLASWLLEALPVGTYCEIAAGDAVPGDATGRLLRAREQLFQANYGLAKAAAGRCRRGDFPEMLSAASRGLLDAIDRYVPGPRASRFAHFAGYWIRHHIDRGVQKSGCVVTFPVNQHRIGRRIRRYLARRRAEDLPPPSEAELCAELRLRPSAVRRHLPQPRVISLDAPADPRGGDEDRELDLCDPGPKPDCVAEEADVAAQLETLLRSRVAPATRVMLAYTRCLGSLADAAEDYLEELHLLARERLRSRPLASEGLSPSGGSRASSAVPGIESRTEIADRGPQPPCPTSPAVPS